MALTPCVAQLITDPVAAKRSKPLREAVGKFVKEWLVTTCPVAEDHYTFGTMGTCGGHICSFSCHGHAKSRWLGCVVHTSEHLYRIPSFLHAKVQPTYIRIMSIHLFHPSRFKPFWRNENIETR